MVTSRTILSDDGIRKAAILVASLDRAAADAVLELLTAEQARQVRQAVVAMETIPDAEQDRVLGEFSQMQPHRSLPESASSEWNEPAEHQAPWGAASYAEHRSEPRFPVEKPTGRPFGKLRDAESEKLAKLLSGERPQTIALVLSHLEPHQAGGVLVRFAPDLQVEVLRRLVDLEETDPLVLQEVERALESRLSKQVQMQRRRVAGIGAISGILEESSSEVSIRLLDNLASRDRRLAEKFAPPPFRFEDLECEDDAFLASVLENVDPGWIMPALLGASTRLIHRVLRLLPYDEAKQIDEKLRHPDPIRLSDVEAARARLAEAGRRVNFLRRPNRAFAA